MQPARGLLVSCTVRQTHPNDQKDVSCLSQLFHAGTSVTHVRELCFVTIASKALSDFCTCLFLPANALSGFDT